MNVCEVMTKNIETVSTDDWVTQAAQKMKLLDVGMLPVQEGDRLAGTITDRDITLRAIAERRDPETTQVREIMTGQVFTCSAEDDIHEAARCMEEHQVRRLIVTDKNDQPIGIVSVGDLAVKSGDDELAGEIVEEVSKPCEIHRSQ